MSTFSPSLRIELITTGDQAGVWGNTTNTNLGTLVESAIAGYTSVSVLSANQALTALNGAADESRNMTLALTTTTGAPFNVYAPPAEKTYVIQNASSFAATIFNSTVLGNTTAAGTGVAVPAGKTVTVWSDGTNFSFQNDHLSSLTLVTDLAIADGGTGASDAAGVRANIGLGTLATQNSNAVSITGGSISGITDLAVADGGTGASDAAGARSNLDVPSRGGANASGTWGINISGTAAAATSPASGGSFITTGNIGGQSVAFATNATNATNSTFASNPASGGSFITSNNIGNQSVNYATNALQASFANTASTAVVADNAIGYNQTWRSVSRALGTTYTNTTGRPIMVCCSALSQSASNPVSAVVDGVTLLNSWTIDCCGVPQFSYFPLSFVVPSGSTYRINGNLGFTAWTELR